MPLLLDPASLPEARLRAMVEESRRDLEELLTMLEQPLAAIKEPLGLVTARDLVRAALAAGGVRPEATARELAVTVNLNYEVQIAAIDLLKMHTDAPKVPRGRRPTAP